MCFLGRGKGLELSNRGKDPTRGFGDGLHFRESWLPLAVLEGDPEFSRVSILWGQRHRGRPGPQVVPNGPALDEACLVQGLANGAVGLGERERGLERALLGGIRDLSGEGVDRWHVLVQVEYSQISKAG